MNYLEFRIKICEMGLIVNSHFNEYNSTYEYSFSHLYSDKSFWTIVFRNDFIFYEELLKAVKEHIQEIIDP